MENNFKAPKIVTQIPGPKSKVLVEIDDKYMMTSTKHLPVAAKRGYGTVIEDMDGNLFLDFNSSGVVVNTGHAHPKVVAAIKEQAEKLIHFAGTDFYYESQSYLMEKLTKIAPGDFSKKVFLTNSGTEANEGAMKIARAATGRKDFISFLGAFHGRTMGSLSLTASKVTQRKGFSPTLPGVFHVPYGNCYRCVYGQKYPECNMRCVKVLEDYYFKSIIDPYEVAGIFIEPIQGEGGYVFPPTEFIQDLAEIAKKYGILLIDDEVQAGMGRAGKMFAIEHYEVVPDIITLAKGIGSGMPIGAIVFDAKLDFKEKGRHSNTYGGNPVASAAALVTIDIIKELLPEVEKKGEYLLNELKSIQKEFPEVIGRVEGKGMMQVIEFVKDPQTKEPDQQLRNEIEEIAFQKGLILLGCGISGIRIAPPLVVTYEEIDAAVQIIKDVLKSILKN